MPTPSNPLDTIVQDIAEREHELKHIVQDINDTKVNVALADVDRDAAEREHEIKLKEMGMEAGWLGRIFGAPSNAPLNIAGSVSLGLLAFGVAHSLIYPSAGHEHWIKISPILTLILGYVLGQKVGRGR